MNTRIPKIVLILLLVCGLSRSVNAQEIPYIPSGPGLRYIVKLNTAALGLKNLSMQHELTFAKRWSFALGMSHMPERGLPKVIIGNEPEEELANLTLKGYSITPELRFYFSGKNPKGFYAAPYVRYSKYTSSAITYEFDIEETYQTEVDFYGTYTQTSYGIMFGAQWKLSRKLILDWWIVGGGMSNAVVNLNAKGDFSLAQLVDFESEFADMEPPVGTMDYTLTASELDVNIHPGLPTLRGLGICLGYIF